MNRLLLLCCALCSLLPIYGQPSEIKADLPTATPLIKQHLTYPMAWGNAPQKNFGKWRKATREVLLQSMLHRPPVVPFEPEVIAIEQRDGYEARKVRFNLSAYSRANAYLLIPDGKGPFPAIVMLHDHGAKFSIGKEKLVRPFGVEEAVMKDATEWIERCYDNEWIADRYAQAGYAVLVTDALFWGERGRAEGVSYEKQETLSANLLQLGMCWSGVITFDDMQSAEFLASLPEVDADRIGALGFSLGAHRAWMVAAASDRIKASAAVCWMNTTEELMTPKNNQTRGQSAYSMLVPGLRNYLDYPHVAAIACPKPALYFAGRNDKLFPVKGVEDAFSILTETYRSQKAADKLQTRIWEEKHFFNRAMQDETLRFFDTHL